MSIKKLASIVLTASSLVMVSQSSQAIQVATGETYAGDPGTYLGTYNPTTYDFGTFEHGFTTPTGFTDYWVFDVNPSGTGSLSANFTLFTNITGFAGNLYFAEATTACGSGVGDICTDVDKGALIGSGAAGSDDDWQILTGNLGSGRYIVEILGSPGDYNSMAYTGQLGFVPVPEPGSLALLGIGLLAFGAARRKVR